MNEDNVVEIVDTDEIVEERKVPKGAIIAGVTAAGVAIACGVKWLFNHLRDSNINYCDINDDEDVIEIDEVVEGSVEE